jgi:hypothetical protein
MTVPKTRNCVTGAFVKPEEIIALREKWKKEGIQCDQQRFIAW